MKWYAAHIVMYVRFKDGNQDKYPIWENVVLLEANSDEEANKKAIIKGHDSEGDSQGSFFWEDRETAWEFAGIRKIIECEYSKICPVMGPR